MSLPFEFSETMRRQLGEAEFAQFERAMAAPPPVSIRFNPLKPLLASSPTTLARVVGEDANNGGRVPWAAGGFYLAERPVFTLDPAFHAGAYYVQEASSMFLEQALRQTLDFSKPLKIMDLCAAPGGKATLIASLLTADGLLVANEAIRSRAPVLLENLEKWGRPNTAVTSADPEEFAPLAGWFDAVVVDAPCSGEGLFRKDENARAEWSPAAVELCVGRQRRILAAAERLVAPGGILVYSTCTYNRSENAGNCAWLLESFDFEAVELKTKPGWGIEKVGTSCQFYPHRLRGEGFFLSVFRKKDDGPAPRPAFPPVFQKLKPLAKELHREAENWLAEPGSFSLFTTPGGEVLALPRAHEGSFLLLDKFLKNKWFGLPMGRFKGRDFVPCHALALSTACSPAVPRLELGLADALLFLKKENLNLPPAAPLGWTLATHLGLPLGWLKILPGRANNYLPPERRIRMEVR